MMKPFLIGLTFVSLVSVAGLSQQKSSRKLVWPLPPEKPRIEFLYAFSSKADIGIEKPWWKKAIDFILGAEDNVGSLVRPQSVAVDSDGRIYVTDIGDHGVHIFDFERKEYKLIKGGNGHLLKSPIGLAVAPDETFYVTDSELGEIMVFDKKGNYLFSIKDGLTRPTGISIYGGLLYVTDTGANQIIVFDLQGHEKFRIGGRGTADREFNFPVYLCAGNDTREAVADRFYVVDAMNFRIQVLRADGTFVYKFGRLGNGFGDFARPKGIALDNDGHIYVVDALFDVVQIFDQEGKLLMAFGGSGNKFGNFLLPSGIFIDSKDRIYVVDSGNKRVQVFQYLK